MPPERRRHLIATPESFVPTAILVGWLATVFLFAIE